MNQRNLDLGLDRNHQWFYIGLKRWPNINSQGVFWLDLMKLVPWRKLTIIILVYLLNLLKLRRISPLKKMLRLWRPLHLTDWNISLTLRYNWWLYSYILTQPTISFNLNLSQWKSFNLGEKTTTITFSNFLLLDSEYAFDDLYLSPSISTSTSKLLPSSSSSLTLPSSLNSDSDESKFDSNTPKILFSRGHEHPLPHST